MSQELAHDLLELTNECILLHIFILKMKRESSKMTTKIISIPILFLFFTRTKSYAVYTSN